MGVRGKQIKTTHYGKEKQAPQGAAVYKPPRFGVSPKLLIIFFASWEGNRVGKPGLALSGSHLRPAAAGLRRGRSLLRRQVRQLDGLAVVSAFPNATHRGGQVLGTSKG